MVVLQRNEVSRNRILFILTLVLAVAVLFLSYSLATPVFAVLAVVSVLAILLSLLQLYGHPKRSQVLLIQDDNDMIIATNVLHERYKLRFLRDILGDNVMAFSDEDRARFKGLEADGFYATMHVQNVRKLILLRLCMMIFDDVFSADRSNRWEHHESANTPEPAFSKREMPRLTSWKSST